MQDKHCSITVHVYMYIFFSFSFFTLKQQEMRFQLLNEENTLADIVAGLVKSHHYTTTCKVYTLFLQEPVNVGRGSLFLSFCTI